MQESAFHMQGGKEDGTVTVISTGEQAWRPKT